jgi:hypothetical protein
VIGYAIFYFGPFFPALSILRKLQARASMGSFVWRHPLWSLAGIVLVVGFVFDAALEIFLVRTGLYVYSQVIPWGSVFAGTTFQFPLIFESVFVCFVMIRPRCSVTATTAGARRRNAWCSVRWLPITRPSDLPDDVRVPQRRVHGLRQLVRTDPHLGPRDRCRVVKSLPRSQLYDPQATSNVRTGGSLP